MYFIWAENVALNLNSMFNISVYHQPVDDCIISIILILVIEDSRWNPHIEIKWNSYGRFHMDSKWTFHMEWWNLCGMILHFPLIFVQRPGLYLVKCLAKFLIGGAVHSYQSAINNTTGIDIDQQQLYAWLSTSALEQSVNSRFG